MVVGSLVSYTLTSNDITYSVMSEAVFSTNQSVMSLPDPEVLKIKVESISLEPLNHLKGNMAWIFF
jgi:hypothetical protein